MAELKLNMVNDLPEPLLMSHKDGGDSSSSNNSNNGGIISSLSTIAREKLKMKYMKSIAKIILLASILYFIHASNASLSSVTNFMNNTSTVLDNISKQIAS